MLRQSLSASLAITLLLSSVNFAVLAKDPNELLSTEKKPDRKPGGPPSLRNRPPEGRRKPGGGLSGGNQCPKTPIELTAILPVGAQGSTLTGQTTFWFYVPYANADVRSGRFSILDRRGKTTAYQTTFTLPTVPGFVSITLPAGTELKTGEYYQWFFNFYCAANTSSRPDREMNGWVIHLSQPPTAGSQGQDAPPALWYDRVNELAAKLQQTPQDAKLRQQWVDLLKELGLEELSKEPIVGPVILPKKNQS